jgi:hypothetical protein
VRTGSTDGTGSPEYWIWKNLITDLFYVTLDIPPCHAWVCCGTCDN